MSHFPVDLFIPFVQKSINALSGPLKQDCEKLCEDFLSEFNHISPLNDSDLPNEQKKEHIAKINALAIAFADRFISQFIAFFKQSFVDMTVSPLRSMTDPRYLEVSTAYHVFHSVLYVWDSCCQQAFEDSAHTHQLQPTVHIQEALFCVMTIELNFYRHSLHDASYTNTTFYDALKSIERKKQFYFPEKPIAQDTEFALAYKSCVRDFKKDLDTALKRAHRKALRDFKNLIVDIQRLESTPLISEEKEDLSWAQKIQDWVSSFPVDFFNLTRPFSLIDSSRFKFVALKQVLIDQYWQKCTKERIRLMRFDSALTLLIKNSSVSKILGVSVVQSKYDRWSLTFNKFVCSLKGNFPFIEDATEIRQLRETAIFAQEIIKQYHIEYGLRPSREPTPHIVIEEKKQSAIVFSRNEYTKAHNSYEGIVAPQPKRPAFY